MLKLPWSIDLRPSSGQIEPTSPEMQSGIIKALACLNMKKNALKSDMIQEFAQLELIPVKPLTSRRDSDRGGEAGVISGSRPHSVGEAGPEVQVLSTAGLS